MVLAAVRLRKNLESNGTAIQWVAALSMSEMQDVQIIPRRRRNADGELDITPMIDITFLLLAFFVVMSKMDPKKNVQLPISEVAASIPEEKCVLIYVTAAGGANAEAEVFLGVTGDQKAEGSNEEIQTQISEYVSEQVRAKPELEYVLIKASGDSKNGLIERVKIAAAKAAGEGRQLLIGVENRKSN